MTDTSEADVLSLLGRLSWPPDVVFRSAEHREGDKAAARAAERDFHRQMAELTVSTDGTRDQSLVRALAVVADASIRPRSDARCPFWNEREIEALEPGALTLLARAAPHIPNLAFRAALIDVAWYRRACRHTHVPEAVEAYLAHADKCLDPAYWVPAHNALRRAVALSAAVGKRDSTFAAVLDRVNAIAVRVGAHDEKYFCAKVLALLVEQKYPRLEELRENVRLAAESAFSAGDHHRAADLLGFVQRAHHASGEAEAVKRVGIRIAEVHEQAARVERARGEFMRAEHLQMEAVKSWRSVGNARTREQQARALLQEIQRENVASLKEVRVAETDLTECVAESIGRVAGLDPLDAIRKFLTMSGTADIEKVRSRTRERLQETVFYSLFGTQALSNAGRRVHKRGPVMVLGTGDADEQKAAEQALEDEVRWDLSVGWQVFAVAGIVPALGQIQLEHNLGADWLWPFVLRSPFVPPGRHASFVRGLDLGLAGDFGTAAHVLMPQFEAAVRHLLEGMGAVVSTLPSSEEQNEYDLNKLFALPEATKLFGADQLFALRTLLTEKSGVNLRNELAHGLFDDGQREHHFAYFWWTTFRLVMFPFLVERPDSVDPDNDEDGASRSTDSPS